MNMRADVHVAEPVLELDPAMRVRERSSLFGLVRRPARSLGPERLFRGGRLDDGGRLPRYALILALALGGLWAPIAGYLQTAPLSFTSEVSLILPGAGASASVNLSDIGQASSSASSPYSSSAVSPTVTYKRLLGANRVVEAAAVGLGLEAAELGEPRVKLVDETSLIHFEVSGASPEEAQARASALLASFMEELDRLRADEIARREASARAPIADYEQDVRAIRDRITALQLESGLVSVEQYDALVADAEALAARVRDTRAALDQAGDEVAALQSALGVDPRMAALTLKLHADAEYQMLSGTMSDHAAELAVTLGKYGENHPEVVAARDAHAGARSRLYARAAQITGLERAELDARIDMSPSGERGRLLAELVTATARRDGLEAQHVALTASLSERKAEVTALMDAAARLDDLNRDYQVAEAVFASALARTDTTKADIYASYPLVQVLEDASLPTVPSSPKTKVAIAAGAAGSLCLLVALLLAWVRRPLIDRLVRSADG